MLKAKADVRIDFSIDEGASGTGGSRFDSKKKSKVRTYKRTDNIYQDCIHQDISCKPLLKRKFSNDTRPVSALTLILSLFLFHPTFSFPFLMHFDLYRTLSLYLPLLIPFPLVPFPVLSFHYIYPLIASQDNETMYLFLQDCSASSVATLRCTAVSKNFPGDRFWSANRKSPRIGTISVKDLLVRREIMSNFNNHFPHIIPHKYKPVFRIVFELSVPLTSCY